MRHFSLSIAVTLLALLLCFLWAGAQGLFVCLLMTIMEVSFSFDNAVINATVLKHMDALWQRRFLTWGMLVAVFGMYYLFPILIVTFATGVNLFEVMRLAVDAPEVYSRHLTEAHTQIATFGGMFLLMVFLTFILDEGKQRHWLGKVERKLSQMGKLEAVEIIVALVLLLLLQIFLPQEERLHAMVAGTFGVALYVIVHSLTAAFGLEEMGNTPGGYSGLLGFVYLNLLDASFSIDAVVGSFAISDDIVIIVLGLSAGAMFVRSLTLQFVQKGVLEQYVYLEHGAHYAIGALAVIMLASTLAPVSEMVTGLAGLVVITLSFWSSIRYNKRFQPPKPVEIKE